MNKNSFDEIFTVKLHNQLFESYLKSEIFRLVWKNMLMKQTIDDDIKINIFAF